MSALRPLALMIFVLILSKIAFDKIRFDKITFEPRVVAECVVSALGAVKDGVWRMLKDMQEARAREPILAYYLVPDYSVRYVGPLC
jgi:hypothetical protein